MPDNNSFSNNFNKSIQIVEQLAEAIHGIWRDQAHSSYKQSLYKPFTNLSLSEQVYERDRVLKVIMPIVNSYIADLQYAAEGKTTAQNIVLEAEALEAVKASLRAEFADALQQSLNHFRKAVEVTQSLGTGSGQKPQPTPQPQHTTTDTLFTDNPKRLLLNAKEAVDTAQDYNNNEDPDGGLDKLIEATSYILTFLLQKD